MSKIMKTVLHVDLSLKEEFYMISVMVKQKMSLMSKRYRLWYNHTMVNYTATSHSVDASHKYHVK